MTQSNSEKLFNRATQLFPGGVNSPVRAFRSVGGSPIFMQRGKGSKLWDVDGNQYIDFCCSWGPLILGHANQQILDAINETAALGTSFGAPTELENRLGGLIIDNHRYLERIRFVSSGTEATMSAIRLARGATGRDKFIKFEGCYHGHADHLLVKAGSGLVTLGTSSSAGVPESFANETIVLPLNDLNLVEDAFRSHPNKIACIILEPIPANNGLLIQSGEFLTGLREICDRHGALLIFDEVISGFRVGFEGAAGLYGVRPDIITFGKIIGGGLPVGAYGSSEAIMSNIAPLGKVYQAGTLSGNPIAMAAGIAQLSQCLQPGFYENLERLTSRLVNGIMKTVGEQGVHLNMFHLGSIFWFGFGDKQAYRTSDDINPATMSSFNKMFHHCLSNGVYFGPSGYEVGFVSAAHTEEDIDKAIQVISEGII